ncbi:unnamed protein product [Arctogadus glacialis]
MHLNIKIQVEILFIQCPTVQYKHTRQKKHSASRHCSAHCSTLEEGGRRLERERERERERELLAGCHSLFTMHALPPAKTLTIDQPLHTTEETD